MRGLPLVSPPYADGVVSFQDEATNTVFDSLHIISKNARINSNERIISLLAKLSSQR